MYRRNMYSGERYDYACMYVVDWAQIEPYHETGQDFFGHTR